MPFIYFILRAPSCFVHQGARLRARLRLDIGLDRLHPGAQACTLMREDARVINVQLEKLGTVVATGPSPISAPLVPYPIHARAGSVVRAAVFTPE